MTFTRLLLLSPLFAAVLAPCLKPLLGDWAWHGTAAAAVVLAALWCKVETSAATAERKRLHALFKREPSFRRDSVRGAGKAGLSVSRSWRYLSAHDSLRGEKLIGEITGRQVWAHIGEDDAEVEPVEFRPDRNPNACDSIIRTQKLLAKGEPVVVGGEKVDEASEPLTAEEAARKGLRFYQTQQDEDGHWPGDYGGPMFLMPGYIITCHVSGHPMSAAKREAMVTYLRNHQQDDGGWGHHIESASTQFGSVLSYVSLRLLGVSQDADFMVDGLRWIHEHGGALTCPSWGKFWLATLGVLDWEAINPVPVELWLLPYAFPLHPGRMWCHSRMVYLPMSYIFGMKHTAKLTDVTRSLREELYLQPYDSIDWDSHRFNCCPLDLYSPPTTACKLLFNVVAWYEKWHVKSLRKAGCEFAIEYIHAEDQQTNYVDIGPVNKMLNALSCWYEDPDSEAWRQHALRLDDYLWVAEDGMKMQGYNGSQLWDTGFAIQACVATGMTDEFGDCMRRAYEYVRNTQVKEDVPKRARFYRHISKGGWPFSTIDHGWPISDCTAEGLKSALLLTDGDLIAEPIADDRLFDAVNIILSYQNVGGGWATYELTRGGSYFEWFNPAEVFGNIMIDYPYVECSSACMQALAKFRQRYPDHRRAEIDHSIAHGAEFIRSIQRDDGSWYGSWAVCFCYGTWFGIWGLLSAGEAEDSPAILRACDFLLSKQRADGGWGESFQSCSLHEYVQNEREGSQVVNTAWSLLALMKAHHPNKEAIARGIDFIKSRQLPSGDFAQESVSGVFNHNCAITYTAYRNVFPIWALGYYSKSYLHH